MSSEKFINMETLEEGGETTTTKVAAREVRERKPEYVNVLSVKELKVGDFWRAVFAEFLATQFFVFFSVGGTIATQVYYTEIVNNVPVLVPGDFQVAVVVFNVILILVVIYAFAHLSGAHFNPAVTFATLLTQRITILRGVMYFLAQMLGAVNGAKMIKIALPSQFEFTLSTPELAPHVSEWEGIVMEFFLTFGLVFGAYAIAFDPRGWGKLSPVAIAVIVGINLWLGILTTGGAMNPARVFGPALIKDEWDHHYIYWLGDMLGGGLGGVLYEYVFMSRTLARPSGPSIAGDNHIKQV